MCASRDLRLSRRAPPASAKNELSPSISEADDQARKLVAYLRSPSNALPANEVGFSGLLLEAKTGLTRCNHRALSGCASSGRPARQRVVKPDYKPHLRDRPPMATEPSRFRRVRGWASKVMGVAAPVLTSVAAAFPPVALVAEGFAEICDYVGGSCELLDMVEDGS